MKFCDQEGCDQLGVFRFTWPGRDEQFACVEHAAKLKQVAAAIGLPLQLIQLTAADHFAASK